MKKTMKRMLASLLAVACLPLTGVTANADVNYYWGTTTWDAVDEMVPFDNHGRFDYTFYDGTKESVEYHPTYLRENMDVVVLKPRKNCIRLVLREDTPYEDASLLIEDTIKEFQQTYQEAHNGASIGDFTILRNSFGDDLKTYDMCFSEVPENADEIEAGILYAFARLHLITEFYGFGATAKYQTGCTYGLLELYPPTTHVINEEWFQDHTQPRTIEYEVDYDAVQAFLDENYPGYQVEEYLTGSFEKEHWGYNENTVLHRIVPSEELSAVEKVELDCIIAEQFHIGADWYFEEGAAEETLGHNSLENKGDVTLDLELDIMDVIAANKGLLGSEALCDTARKNADISGDGTPDTTDSLAIMKEIVGITEDFQET